ncbi:MAG: SDR family NAD(P)-dependent oxidoreductase [Acidobacteriota bacterium]
MSRGKRALVTGAGGFVGANLARDLLRNGCEVHLLSHRNDQTWRIDGIRDHCTVVEGDLCDRESVARIVARSRPEWVFHCAVYGAYSWQESVERMVQTNVLGTVHLLQLCLAAGVESFVNTGSSSEYGYKDHAAAEDERIEPNSDYALTKASATMYCRMVAASADAAITTLRLYSVYGPYEDPGRFLPTLIRSGLEGRLPPLVAPDVARDYVSVEDVCLAYRLAAGRSRAGEPGAIYNVGTGKQTSVREAVAIARRLLGVSREPEWGSMPNRLWDTETWVADARKIERELDWRPADDFERGFRRMVAWSRTRETSGSPAMK